MSDYIEEHKAILAGDASVTDGLLTPEIRYNETLFSPAIIYSDPVITVISPFQSCYIIDSSGVYVLDSNNTKIVTWQIIN